MDLNLEASASKEVASPQCIDTNVILSSEIKDKVSTSIDDIVKEEKKSDVTEDIQKNSNNSLSQISNEDFIKKLEDYEQLEDDKCKSDKEVKEKQTKVKGSQVNADQKASSDSDTLIKNNLNEKHDTKDLNKDKNLPNKDLAETLTEIRPQVQQDQKQPQLQSENMTENVPITTQVVEDMCIDEPNSIEEMDVDNGKSDTDVEMLSLKPLDITPVSGDKNEDQQKHHVNNESAIKSAVISPDLTESNKTNDLRCNVKTDQSIEEEISPAQVQKDLKEAKSNDILTSSKIAADNETDKIDLSVSKVNERIEVVHSIPKDLPNKETNIVTSSINKSTDMPSRKDASVHKMIAKVLRDTEDEFNVDIPNKATSGKSNSISSPTTTSATTLTLKPATINTMILSEASPKKTTESDTDAVKVGSVVPSISKSVGKAIEILAAAGNLISGGKIESQSCDSTVNEVAILLLAEKQHAASKKVENAERDCILTSPNTVVDSGKTLQLTPNNKEEQQKVNINESRVNPGMGNSSKAELDKQNIDTPMPKTLETKFNTKNPNPKPVSKVPDNGQETKCQIETTDKLESIEIDSSSSSSTVGNDNDKQLLPSEHIESVDNTKTENINKNESAKSISDSNIVVTPETGKCEDSHDSINKVPNEIVNSATAEASTVVENIVVPKKTIFKLIYKCDRLGFKSSSIERCDGSLGETVATEHTEAEQEISTTTETFEDMASCLEEFNQRFNPNFSSMQTHKSKTESSQKRPPKKRPPRAIGKPVHTRSETDTEVEPKPKEGTKFQPMDSDAKETISEKINDLDEEDHALVGCCVLAKWVDRKFYSGRILSSKPSNKYEILFEDERRSVIHQKSIVFGDTESLPLKNHEVYAQFGDDYEKAIIKSIDHDDGVTWYTAETEAETKRITAKDIYLNNDQVKKITPSIVTTTPVKTPAATRTRRRRASLNLSQNESEVTPRNKRARPDRSATTSLQGKSTGK